MRIPLFYCMAGDCRKEIRLMQAKLKFQNTEYFVCRMIAMIFDISKCENDNIVVGVCTVYTLWYFNRNRCTFSYFYRYWQLQYGNKASVLHLVHTYCNTVWHFIAVVIISRSFHAYISSCTLYSQLTVRHIWY